MTTPVPTKLGDILILWTAHRSFATHAIGVVVEDDQQDFCAKQNAQYTPDGGTAISMALTLATPGRRIFFRNIDSKEWREVTRGDEGAQSPHLNPN